MKQRISLVTLLILGGTLLSGCWNYREVDELSIVAGVAVDKGPTGQYIITAEIIHISGGKDTKTVSKTLTMEGKTIFDAVRNEISIAGKKLYWSHTKVIIISKDVAREGVKGVLEWYTRDSETREDVHVLVSDEASAREIFNGQGTTEDIKSFTLDEMLKNQVGLSKAPVTDILHFDIGSRTPGMSQVLPVVRLKQINKEKVPQIGGTAIVKNDKLVGFLNDEETKDLLFIRDELKGGLLLEELPPRNRIGLEIFKNKTKFKPLIEGKDIKMDINVKTTVAIGEIIGSYHFFQDKGEKKLEVKAEQMLKERLEALIRKVQSKYAADIFGFGAKLQQDNVQEWNRVGNHWEEVFKGLKVNVKTQVHIKNSGILAKSLDPGD